MNTLLHVNNLHIAIGNKKICSALNLTLAPGDIWGVLGANGSGKTTLLHTVAGMNPANSGEIYFSDHLLATFNAKQRARAIGILLQDTHLQFPQTVFEFCLSGRYAQQSYFAWENSADRQITHETLALLQLESLAQQNILTLSGGERRRLAIATLLVQAPQIYFLDEPLNHLDISHQVQVLNHFKKLAHEQSVGIMMAIHDVNFAYQYCNKILMLFAAGEHLIGCTNELINQENLSRLYRHPMQNHRESWQPLF